MTYLLSEGPTDITQCMYAICMHTCVSLTLSNNAQYLFKQLIIKIEYATLPTTLYEFWKAKCQSLQLDQLSLSLSLSPIPPNHDQIKSKIVHHKEEPDNISPCNFNSENMSCDNNSTTNKFTIRNHVCPPNFFVRRFLRQLGNANLFLLFLIPYTKLSHMPNACLT